MDRSRPRLRGKNLCSEFLLRKQEFLLEHFRLRCSEFTPSCHSDRSPTDGGGRTAGRKPEDVCSTMLLQGVLTERLKAHARGLHGNERSERTGVHLGNPTILCNLLDICRST